ncbi:MAG: hypothetical protein ABI609_07625 [Acidobacteriota bacterium]
MSASPAELRLEITPRARFDVIDINQRILEQHGGVLQSFQKAVYFSYHTTAGYLEQALSARLNGGKEGSDALQPYIEVFQTLFPAGASYRHDQMELRDELSLEQKVDEPRNADSHLAYIGSGLRSCVTYKNRPGSPVYFIDLDGEYEGKHRRRLTSVVGYNADRNVATRTLEIPVSGHPIDSINLKDPKFGLYQSIQELVTEHGVARGRIDVALGQNERQAGLTVNEYETLLMKHDLIEVLRDPVRFMKEKGRHMLSDPRAIPNRTIEYAKFDLVTVLNRLIDVLGMNESLVEKVLARLMALPADRFLRMKRGVSLLVSSENGESGGSVVQGQYQSPILVQWEKAAGQSRTLELRLTEFS